MEQDYDRGAFIHGHPMWPREGRVSLQPLGHRVLIQPDEQPTETDSGLVLPEDRHHVSMSGTIMAVGKGSRLLWEARRKERERVLGVVDACDYDGPTIAGVKDTLKPLIEPMPTLSVGDRVAYPVDAGMTLTENGQQYIIMNEDDVVVLVEESAGV